ncbi:MAG TPA: bifunctional hydroxymethylpyrimidine kinase/phosphomethylpyrimidine kinase [Rhodobacteraceae bacterium]|jgi:hydroxymethylpyrimidine/phosphomethylpyrimidine kinase|nr:bifunctional hydroxymethylpyrimidine kinase/phosphomethylpyrimidine kinase [Paracoccaceae bacterium]HBR63010.1 bifunctional hydroxymethylpyrimidine kinase/phosphomethylpyrimidine kinase [Paracoccaceae bacterium]|tara:strand:- start:140 stop:943 length:804 start_codon:yes stop_codon:yes gene_type:complete
MKQIFKALTIAGSDSGGGAGIQADLKTFSALGVYGASVITAITAQNTCAVTAVQGLAPDLVSAQIDAVMDDIAIDAVKIGMLADPEIVNVVAVKLAGFEGPIVLDPVMVAKSGDALLTDDAVQYLIERLIPLATVLTPNLPEAARLVNQPMAETPAQVIAQGRAILNLGAAAVVMKGGHGRGAICTDYLVQPETDYSYQQPRIATENTHGTGCTLSSAIAAFLAQGVPLDRAVQKAIDWLHGAVQAADQLSVGQGHGPVHHFYKFWQ